MDGDDAAKAEWILKAFGYSIPADTEGPAEGETIEARAAQPPEQPDSEQPGAEKEGETDATRSDQDGPEWAEALKAWEVAHDAVKGQIETLRAALMEKANSREGVEDETLPDVLKDIADNVLPEIMSQFKQVDDAVKIGGGREEIQKSGPKAVEQIHQCLNFIETDEMVQQCDANPFDVPVAIRATLEPPLQQMAKVLQAAAG